MGEILSVQTPLVKALVAAGWTYVAGKDLDRAAEEPFIEADVAAALVRLNPVIAEDPSSADEVLMRLRAIAVSARETGAVTANKEMMEWLRGLGSHQFVGTTQSIPIKLIDFDSPANNRLVVSDEVSYGTPKHMARFDVVLWVNGLPLVVGELKSPVQLKVSWMKGATELAETYQPGWPGFFASNVLVFATEGKELRYAGVGTPANRFDRWGPNLGSPGMHATLEAVRYLLAPSTVLDIARHFTLFEWPESNDAGEFKIVPRYVQYEAVQLIVQRAKDRDRTRALIHHTQGSGKTLAMVFAAGQLLKDPGMGNPTVVLIADRTQLVTQMWDQFRTVGLPQIQTPSTAAQLQQLLADISHGGEDGRGLVVTTIHKFRGAPVLNERRNIVVMVDEAHRTQEGDLGLTMRAALPGATMVAFTGTPIAKLKHNTFHTFGDPDDGNRTLHSYTQGQSIADGMTLPIHVAPRKVEFTLDKAAIDADFAELAKVEGLEEEERELLAGKASKLSTFFANPERVSAVCADIINHFYGHVDPLGMKAQVVVYNRAACVAYQQELTRLLAERHNALASSAADGAGGPPVDESAVVMTVAADKNTEIEWQQYRLDEAAEQAVLKRFRTFGDSLKFLVVTSKLGTGFNAPIEGVMYLDKPLREHTLAQTIARVNRRWRNPDTRQDKHHAIIVDYIGLGDEFSTGNQTPHADSGTNPAMADNLDELVAQFAAELKAVMKSFSGLDWEHVDTGTLIEAQARIPAGGTRDEFATEYMFLQGIWEAASPHDGLRPHRPAYRFLSQVYASVTPSKVDDHIWHRLGAKTLEIVHGNTHGVHVTGGYQFVVTDADAQQLLDEGLIAEKEQAQLKTPQDIVDGIAARLQKRLAGNNGDHPVYKSLAERLEKLRQQSAAAVQQSIDWLRDAFQLANDVTAAANAEHENGAEGLDLLPDPRINALTQIFNEFAPPDSPELMGMVVAEVDKVVTQVRFDGWKADPKADRLVKENLRTILRKFQLHKIPGLFDRAYQYIAQHY